MADLVVMRFGDFSFRVGANAHKSLSRKITFKHTSVDRFKKRPLSFFEGAGDETITISGMIVLTEREKPEDSMRALREIGLKGRPETLVDGRGTILGRFVLIDLDEKHEEIKASGEARYIEFSMGLKQYE